MTCLEPGCSYHSLRTASPNTWTCCYGRIVGQAPARSGRLTGSDRFRNHSLSWFSYSEEVSDVLQQEFRPLDRAEVFAVRKQERGHICKMLAQIVVGSQKHRALAV